MAKQKLNTDDDDPDTVVIEEVVVEETEDDSDEGYQQTNSDVKAERGMGSPNYPQDVAEEARKKGGEHSHDGDNDQPIDEE